MNHAPGLAQVVIYDHPADYPLHVVAREWMVSRGGIIAGHAHLVDTVEDARALIKQSWPNINVCLPRSPEDDPTIVEVWT